jgi:hypothetical protein
MSPRLLRPMASSRFLLDQFGGAAAAYSLRRLSSYTGDAVRVRRSNDSAEEDFTPEEIANGTLTAWTGANDGFVQTWYDQSGNSRHGTQTTSTAQPKIVSSGALILESSRPFLEFDGSNHFIQIDTVTTLGVSSASNPHTIAAVYRCDNAGSGGFIGSNYNSTGLNVLGFEAAKPVNLRAGAASTNTANTSQDTSLHVGIHLYSGGSAPRTFAGRVDGTTLPTTPADGVFTDSGSFESTLGYRIGRWGSLSLFFDGKLSEWIIWPSHLIAAAAQIEFNINARFGIF